VGTGFERGPVLSFAGPVTYVITSACIGKKDASCADVCPVDCIHPTTDEAEFEEVDHLYINPQECIDCDACVEACPHDAVFAEDQLPEDEREFVERNAAFYR
jgi:NAD-dependent dihydropyrimidine dehydrogenase PreA subunit